MAVPNDLKLANRRHVLLKTLQSEPTTRSALSRATGLSQATTGKIADELLADGILRNATEDGNEAAGPGRPGIFLKLDDVQPRFLAIQLGIVHTRLAPLTVAPPPSDAWSKVFETPQSVHQWIKAVVEAVESMGTYRFSAALVSVPGVLDEATGTPVLSPHARWMEGEPLAAELHRALGIPVHMIQEVQCLARGHQMADPMADNYLLVDFGIGIGCAAMVRRNLMRGPFPFSGELGHTPVPGNLNLCNCGGMGCLETLVGRERLFGEDSAYSTDHLPDNESSKVPQPQRVARLRAALEAAGLAIAGALNVVGLKHAVITGFAADLPPEEFDVLRKCIAASAIAGRFGSVRTDAAPRHWQAGLASVGIDLVLATP